MRSTNQVHSSKYSTTHARARRLTSAARWVRPRAKRSQLTSVQTTWPPGSLMGLAQSPNRGLQKRNDRPRRDRNGPHLGRRYVAYSHGSSYTCRSLPVFPNVSMEGIGGPSSPSSRKPRVVECSPQCRDSSETEGV